MSTLNTTNIKYRSVRDKSFGLLRTNPKLTTNAKIVIDSSDNIFLSSFSATKNLSSGKFKRFKLDSRGSYSMDLSRFYGSVPMTERFEVMRKFSDTSTYNEYSKQFEHQYNYGAEFNDTKLYDEQYKFLAPIWLNKNIPSKFVVYRVETATHKDIQNPSSYLGQNEKIMEMLGNASIVADFDLSRKSKIGEYIRNHAEDNTRSSSGLTFNFDTEEPCVYKGIDVKYGGFTSKEEYLGDDYIRKDDIEVYKNELLTEGFERNGLAFSNILNLEFMFDDNTGEKYKTYRYFGLYVDSIKEGSLKLSQITSDSILYDGADSEYDVSGLSLGTEAAKMYMVPNNDEFNLPTLNYIKDKNYKLYHIKNNHRGINDNRIYLNIQDLAEFKGYSERQGTLTINQKKRSFKSFIKVEIKEAPNHLDRFFIGNRFTMAEDNYNMGSYTMLADSSLDVGKINGNRFSNKGTVSQITMAIADVIKNNIDEGRVKVTPFGQYLKIESYVVGEDRNQMMFGIYNNNLVDFIDALSTVTNDMGLNTATSTPSPTVTFTDWKIYTLRGGAGENQGMLVSTNEGKVDIGLYVKEKDIESYIKIVDVVPDFGGNNYRVILDKPAALANNGIVKLYSKFNAEFGKLSAYDLKDLRFDFHDNDISGLGSLVNDLGFGKYQLNKNIKANDINDGRFRGLTDNILGSDSVGQISNIYKRLRENEIKETAILSRIVPYINTFARVDSSNVRGNDYILNVNESMGIDNMSPNINVKNVDFKYMNIEHYTMGQLPKLQASIRNTVGTSWDQSIPSDVFAKKGLNNIDDSLLFAYNPNGTDYTGGDDFISFDATKAKDITFDYFSLFENFNGYYNYTTSNTSIHPTEAGVTESWENMKKVNHSDIIRKGTVFSKGVNYKFSESLDGYRFMNILRYEHSTDTNDTLIEVIKNEKYKTLVVFVTIITKENNIPEYGLTKGHMYSVNDITEYNTDNNIGSVLTYTLTTQGSGFLNAGESNLVTTATGTATGTGATLSFPSLPLPNGYLQGPLLGNSGGTGYKVGDVLSVAGSATTLNATVTVASVSSTGSVLESGMNPSIPATSGVYADSSSTSYVEVPLTLIDAPLKSTFDFNGSVWPAVSSPTDPMILRASNESILAGDARFNSQITRNSVGEYSYIKFYDGVTQYAVKILEVISDTALIIAGYPVEVTGVFNLTSNYYTNMPSHLHDDFASITLHNGGENGFKGLFNSVSVGSVAKRFIDNIGVKYNTVYSNGSSELKGPSIEIINASDVLKASEKRAVGDTDKPSSFAVSTGSVGFNIVDKEIKYITKIRRHNGDYNPAVKNIISFDSIYNEHKLDRSTEITYTDVEKKQALIYAKFNGLGIAFESWKNSIEDYGILKNFYYHKVNENVEIDIIKLSESSDKLPLYPLIGEIAIDKTDLNILDSKYSDSFFKRSMVGLSLPENAHGTKSAEEIKSFMSSTVMKVNDIYNIDTFSDAVSHENLNELNETYDDDLNTSSIHFFEDELRIFADFYMTDALRETLITDGILYKFSENVNVGSSYGDTDTITDDISEYIKHNIINRYIIDSIDVYVHESKDLKFTGFSNDVSQLTNYKKSTSHSLESFNDKEIGFRFIFEKRVGYKYDFKLNIKIKA